jgi:hypothetical protein
MDMNSELMLDGNAVSGMLYQVFGAEMTTSPAECAHCGVVTEMGGMLAFTQAPGIVLRCPACGGILLRMVETPDAIWLEARGVASLRMSKSK